MKTGAWIMKNDSSDLNQWIVWKEEGGRIKLVSKIGTNGMIPKGAYLTVEDNGCKFILRVDESRQSEPFEPSPLIADMNLKAIAADRQCKNIVSAYRVKTIDPYDDDLIKYIRPLCVARKSTQDEIDLAMGVNPDSNGPKVFVATIFANENKILRDNNNELVLTRLPNDFYYYQTMICGKTGSGKTVAMKYLAQNFIEETKGAVLAINVKEQDFLRMDVASNKINDTVLKEWARLNNDAHPLHGFTVYYPSKQRESDSYRKLTATKQKITLNLRDIEPEALLGLVRNVSDLAADSLPDIFRYWRQMKKQRAEDILFKDFFDYVNMEESRCFSTLNILDQESTVTLFPGTYRNIVNGLRSASKFFDDPSASMLTAEDILTNEKMSVIDVASDIQFGSLILRDLLKKLIESKSNKSSNVPLLIIIDEVHQFYNGYDSKNALDDLATICRTGRSMEIGVIFSSQNPSDMPPGIPSVVNTKIYFKTESQGIKDIGSKITIEEMESMQTGFAIASIYDLPQLKVLKFPLSFAGVVREHI